MQLTLEGDSGGVPNGVVLGGPVNFTAAVGWNNLVFSPAANLTAGTPYQLVIQWDGTSPPLSPSNYPCFVVGTQPNDGIYPLTQAVDPNMGSAVNNGVSWTFDASIKTAFIINYGGTWAGNPLVSHASNVPVSDFIDSSNSVGEVFSLTNSASITSVGAFIVYSIFPSAPADNLYWAIRDTSSGAILGSGTLTTPSSLPSGQNYGWFDTAISPLNLSPGTYRFELSSPLTSPLSIPITSGYYRWTLENPGSTTAPYINLTYGGATDYAQQTTTGGTVWTTPDNGADDLPFRFYLACTPTPTPGMPGSFCDQFYVSKNLFRPSQGPVSIRVDYCMYPGDFSLRIYNSAGEHVKTLDQGRLDGPLHQSYSWDGTNKYGDACASGVYLFYLREPYGRRTARILLVR
jgi:hypothetical protein